MSLNPTQLARDEAFARRLLAGGVLVSAAFLLAGLVLWLAGGPAVLVDPLLDAGLVLLMATPVARVAVSVLESIQARDWRFLAASLLVLLVLAGTLASALRQ